MSVMQYINERRRTGRIPNTCNDEEGTSGHDRYDALSAPWRAPFYTDILIWEYGEIVPFLDIALIHGRHLQGFNLASRSMVSRSGSVSPLAAQLWPYQVTLLDSSHNRNLFVVHLS
jgi:hypothetical protein